MIAPWELQTAATGLPKSILDIPVSADQRDVPINFGTIDAMVEYLTRT